MLIALSIRSFLLIEQLELECGEGFCALTGETGAGKSIILGALNVVLGGQAPKSLIRRGDNRASVSATFAPGADNPIWHVLAERGIDASPGDGLTLRRVMFAGRPSRAFINDQAVSAATLGLVSDHLVEVHGQHAASRLMHPSTHRTLLDAFAGNDDERRACRQAWDDLQMAKTDCAALEAHETKARAQFDWLSHAVEELRALSPEPGEASALAARRALLCQSEKLIETMVEGQSALSQPLLEDSLARAARASDRLIGLLEADSSDMFRAVQAATDAVERAIIELNEAQSSIDQLSRYFDHDGDELEQVEARLFALRAVGRKYEADVDTLHLALADFEAQYCACETQTEQLEAARAKLVQSEAAWASAANDLTASRRRAAAALPARMARELKPLQLGRVKVRAVLEALSEEDSGVSGQERVIFEVETNPGAGFGPLQTIASGGELARFSLALKCALSDRPAAAETMVFDEVDQGVGGAVAAAIGERLAALAQTRQVFAITHSPQVAAFAARQWRVSKQDNASGEVLTEVAQLDEGARLEEIARMLSGSSVTDEARAAASKLLEAA